MSDTRNTVETSDTSATAHDFYVQRLKEMNPSERLALGSALWKQETLFNVPRPSAIILTPTRLKLPSGLR